MELISPKYVLDTNIALYHLGGRLSIPLPAGQYHLSIISEIELLSYSDLSREEQMQINQFIAQLNIVPITDTIKFNTIDLRQQYRLKLPDAIIAATALSLEATLLTNDLKLTKLGRIQAQSLVLK